MRIRLWMNKSRPNYLFRTVLSAIKEQNSVKMEAKDEKVITLVVCMGVCVCVGFCCCVLCWKQPRAVGELGISDLHPQPRGELCIDSLLIPLFPCCVSPMAHLGAYIGFLIFHSPLWNCWNCYRKLSNTEAWIQNRDAVEKGNKGPETWWGFLPLGRWAAEPVF